MDKLLARQLRRALGLGEAELETALAQLSAIEAKNLPPAAAQLLAGLPEFLKRVAASYEQNQRDLDLRTRSLELSSDELSTANDRLRGELASRERAMQSLRDTARSLLGDADRGPDLDAQENLEALSRLMARLVTERKRMADELAASARRYRSVVESLREVIYRSDSEGRFTFLNPAWYDITGHKVATSIGTTSLEYLHADDMPRAHASLNAMFKGDADEQRDEFRFRTSDGGYRWFEVYARRELDAARHVIGFTGTLNDVTERRQARERLEEQLHLVQELVEAMPVPVYLKDTEGRYLRVNKAFEEISSVKREEWLGRTIAEAIAPENAERHWEKDRELLTAPGIQTYEMRIRTPFGVERDVMYRKATLTRPDGTIAGLVGTITDITERKRWEEEMQRAKEAAESANRAKSDFLANMSHEIRTPMNGIIGMTGLALDTDDPEQQREYLRIVQSSADALLTIINDILDFSKIEAGKLLIERISFDPRRTLSETLKTFAIPAHEKGLELVSDIAPEVPEVVMGDPGRLRQIIVNLVGNAIKFTERGEIVLRVVTGERSGSAVELLLSVSDTGIGIPRDKLASIFDAFTQEDSSTTRRYGGTGLGLAISNRLVTMMGGELRVESEQGKGSLFRFNLHLDVDTTPREQLHLPVTLAGRSALVVDDNAVNRTVLAHMLERWGIAVRQAGSGPAAIAALKEAATDVVLLDVWMPEMDGFEVAKRLQAGKSSPPVIVLSSGGAKGDAARCRELGVAGYLPKPVHREDLLQLLHRVLAAQPGAEKKLITRHALREAQTPLAVLLVEDHPVNQMLAVRLLERWGHRVSTAENGEQALSVLSGRRFDAVLMDLQMPVMGGLEATRLWRAKETGPRVPIIAMTASAMASDREACIEAGMDDYVAKPLNAEQLFEILQRLGSATSPASDTGAPAQT